MNKIVIIDYDMGNTLSIINALKKLSVEAVVSNDKNVINHAKALILPGVGAYPEAMKNLEKYNLIDLLNENVLNNKKPILGICLGMQIMSDYGEEILVTKGLGWIPGEVKRIETKELRIPHVGWNSIEILNSSVLFQNISSDSHFYFDHSYEYICSNTFKSSQTLYDKLIVSSIEKDNIFATQFHPEKSQTMGLKILKNFLTHVETQSC